MKASGKLDLKIVSTVVATPIVVCETACNVRSGYATNEGTFLPINATNYYATKLYSPPQRTTHRILVGQMPEITRNPRKRRRHRARWRGRGDQQAARKRAGQDAGGVQAVL